MAYILYYKHNNSLRDVQKDKVIDDLYYLKARIPKKSDLESASLTKNASEFFKGKKFDDAIEIIINDISRIDYKIPLYDEYSKNLYIISRDKVYSRVIYQHYRFPDKNMFEKFKERKIKLESVVKNIAKTEAIEQNLSDFSKDYKIHYAHKESSAYFTLREYRKLTLMIKFLSSFNLKILEETYIKAFYYYSNEVGKDITICQRPSFLPHFKHIDPYYTRRELINLALNQELIKPSDKYYDDKEVSKLCELIKKNDVDSKILLDHQKYIVDKNKIGIVQYYSLQGSYFMNQYMRGFTTYKYQNPLMEDCVRSMWELINDAPKLNKSYILYRFIKNDPHLKELKIGDTYMPPGFLSTTRDPFYRSDVYKFGFILIKIKIPKDVKGVALCMETISHFPDEEEIILSPLSVLRLDRKDMNAPYFHIDDIHESKIKTRYEFTYVGKKKLELPKRDPLPEKKEAIDFLKIKKADSISIEERIRFFIKNYVNEIYQFSTNIGNNKFTLITEWYDSTEAYKKFYASKTNNGFMIYTIINNHIGFTIELGEDIDGSYMYVNYYFKYSTTYRKSKISDKDFIDFLAKLAFYFEIKYVILYADYTSCDLKASILDKRDESDYKRYQGGNFCTDFYMYFKYGEKRYSEIKVDKTVLYPKFTYYNLDRLKETDPLKILTKDDRDEVYQIYVKTYKPFVNNNKHNLADFYVYMVDNHCVYMDKFLSKMSRLFKEDNPFDKDYYVLDGITYLYNKELIDIIPTFDDSKTEGPKNEYRITENRASRVPRSRIIT